MIIFPSILILFALYNQLLDTFVIEFRLIWQAPQHGRFDTIIAIVAFDNLSVWSQFHEESFLKVEKTF